MVDFATINILPHTVKPELVVTFKKQPTCLKQPNRMHRSAKVQVPPNVVDFL